MLDPVLCDSNTKMNREGPRSWRARMCVHIYTWANGMESAQGHGQERQRELRGRVAAPHPELGEVQEGFLEEAHQCSGQQDGGVCG